jgi:cell division septum initiation protein DivIVA
MDYTEADKLVKQLSTGFETLQEEYQKLFGQHEALERKLATARDQVSISPATPYHLHQHPICIYLMSKISSRTAAPN